MEKINKDKNNIKNDKKTTWKYWNTQISMKNLVNLVISQEGYTNRIISEVLTKVL